MKTKIPSWFPRLNMISWVCKLKNESLQCWLFLDLRKTKKNQDLGFRGGVGQQINDIMISGPKKTLPTAARAWYHRKKLSMISPGGPWYHPRGAVSSETYRRPVGRRRGVATDSVCTRWGPCSGVSRWCVLLPLGVPTWKTKQRTKEERRRERNVCKRIFLQVTCRSRFRFFRSPSCCSAISPVCPVVALGPPVQNPSDQEEKKGRQKYGKQVRIRNRFCKLTCRSRFRFVRSLSCCSAVSPVCPVVALGPPVQNTRGQEQKAGRQKYGKQVRIRNRFCKLRVESLFETSYKTSCFNLRLFSSCRRPCCVPAHQKSFRKPSFYDIINSNCLFQIEVWISLVLESSTTLRSPRIWIQNQCRTQLQHQRWGGDLPLEFLRNFPEPNPLWKASFYHTIQFTGFHMCPPPRTVFFWPKSSNRPDFYHSTVKI